ncbi:MAG: thiopeptide-type bacteriocin biosynthesis protein [Egibacteraceae bacterium]
MTTCASPTSAAATPANASSSSVADEGPAPDKRWVSAHLFYHDDLDELLCSGVRPLIDELAASGLITGFFFVRYWQGGRHVRLRVLPTDEVGEEPVKGLIDTRVGRFFAACPSQVIVRREDYLQAAAWMCQQEFGQRKITIEPLQPNNSIGYVPYVPEYDRCGGPQGVAAIEPHFMDSSAIALELIANKPSPGQYTGRALAMMLLAAAVLIPDPERLTQFFQGSYRNWAAKLWSGDRTRYERYETQFQRRYDQQRPQLDDLARRLLREAHRPAPDGLDPTSARWMTSVTALRDRLTGLALEGRRLGTQPLLFQCLHKHNNRLGIGLSEETYLLFLLQRTLAEITDARP